MEEKINHLLLSLDWNCSEEEQKRAIQELITYKEVLVDSIITSTDKYQWPNVIKFIGLLDKKDQVKFVPQMLFLLQDMNWPGALDATELMVRLSHTELKPHISRALTDADKEKDTIWIAWIKAFLDKAEMNDLLIEYKDILDKAEW